MRQVILRRATALLLPLALASCALPLPQVDDIAVSGIELVEHVPKPDSDGPHRGMDGPFLRITFTSAHDFQKLAHDWNYTLGYDVASCAGGGLDKARPLVGFAGVFDAHGPIFMYADKRLTSGPGTPLRYHLYVAVRAEPDLDRPADVVQHAYDLKARPQDICLRIVGVQEVDGDGWGFAKFKSNVVRIVQAVVAGVLR